MDASHSGGGMNAYECGWHDAANIAASVPIVVYLGTSPSPAATEWAAQYSRGVADYLEQRRALAHQPEQAVL